MTEGSGSARVVSGRVAILVAIGAGAIAAVAWWPASSIEGDRHTLSWVATAHQFGPVGYRDPAGALSPDGRWIAYSEGRFLRVRPIDGGPTTELPPGEAQIRNLAWSADSRTIAADGYRTPSGWAVYDRVERTRRGLWTD